MDTYRFWLIKTGIPADALADVVSNVTDNTTYYDFLKSVPEERGVVAEAYRHVLQGCSQLAINISEDSPPLITTSSTNTMHAEA